LRELLYGTEGDIIYTRDESTKKIDLCTEKARLPKGHEESWTFQINSAYYQQPHTHLIQDFVKSIIQGRAMGKLPTIEYGRGVQEIMEAACESNSKKATMQLPLT